MIGLSKFEKTNTIKMLLILDICGLILYNVMYKFFENIKRGGFYGNIMFSNLDRMRDGYGS